MIAPAGRRAAVLAAAVALSVPAHAQTKDLTWDQAVAAAADANPDLAASRFSLEASRASYYQSFNGVLPKVSLSNSVSDGSAVRRADRWSAGATASVSLLDASQFASIKSASAAETLSEAVLRRTSADLRSDLRRAFTHALAAEENLRVSKLVENLREHDAEMVTLRYDSGRESKGNMLRAKAQALQSQAAAAQAERDLRTARRELAQRLGREDYVEYNALGVFGAPEPPARPAELRELLPLRPEVMIAEASLRQSNASVSLAESSLWPSLTADYSRNRAGPTEFPSRDYGWSAGATLRYSLFGEGPTATWYGVKAARRGRSATERDLASARVAGLTALESAWSAYASAADQVRVQAALLNAARQRNDEADIRYASGLLSYDNWELIVSDRVSSESQNVSALRNAMDAETAWNRALGRALGE